MLMTAIGVVAMLLGFLGFVLCLGLNLAAVGLVRLVVFRTLAVFVVKEMICLNYRKLKPLRGR